MIRRRKHTNYETNPPVKMRFWNHLGVRAKNSAGFCAEKSYRHYSGSASSASSLRTCIALEHCPPPTAQLTGGAVGFSLFACE